MPMTAQINDMSPQKAARVAGVLYLTIIAGGIFAEAFVRQQALVPGDPAATARYVLEHELLYRLGFAVHVFYLACALPLALILYNFFKRVSNNLALLALIFNLIAVAIEGVNLLNHFAPLDLLATASLSAFSEQQLQALAYGSLASFSSGFDISLVFFGFFGVLAGILIFKSGFLPRILGVLMTVAGLCYIINSFSIFVVPAVAAQLFPYILMPCIVAELSFALWLLVMGVNVSKIDGAATRQSAQTSAYP